MAWALRKTALLAQRIHCAFCDAYLTPAEFRHHEHEDVEWGRYGS